VLIGIWTALTASAAEPCYGWLQPKVVEGERVSVEYDDLVSDQGAQTIVDVAEDAWDAYEAVGFRGPVGTPSFSIEVDPLGRGGFATAQRCGEEFFSKLYVYESSLAFDGGRNTAVHELFHAVQYGYNTGFDHTAHFASWPWWLEGTATWAELVARGFDSHNHDSFEDYLSSGHLALHQDVTAVLVPERSAFLYGTAVLAYTLEDREEIGRAHV